MLSTYDILIRALDRKSKTVLYALAEAIKDKNNRRVSLAEINRMHKDLFGVDLDIKSIRSIVRNLVDMEVLTAYGSKRKMYSTTLDVNELEKTLKEDLGITR